MSLTALRVWLSHTLRTAAGRPADPSLIVTLNRAGRHLRQLPAEWLQAYWPGRTDNPVFVVGCPRSGTTIMGKVLGRTPGWAHLHEPAYIWSGLNPALDIWNDRLPHGVGQLAWEARHLNSAQARVLAQRFHLEMTLRRGRRVIEKTPENAFRMEWLAAVFPRAQFVHIVRHARDAALSLVNAVPQWAPPGHWERSGGYLKFRDYAASVPELATRLPLVDGQAGNYRRCLLVWLSSLYAAQQAGHVLGPCRYYEIRYEALVTQAPVELERLYRFLDEPLSPQVLAYARAKLQAGSLGRQDPEPAATRAIAGDALARLGYAVEAA